MTTKVLILAAGRGERIRPLTDATPKPLLRVRGNPLIDLHVEAFDRGGFNELVINTDWLGAQIANHFDHGNKLSPTENVSMKRSITYSHEGIDFGGALETAGGIARALPLLGEVFWVVAGDVFMPSFEFLQSDVDRFVANGKLAHLWLVPNPDHNAKGDFGLDTNGLAFNLPVSSPEPHLTFSTLGLYRKDFFQSLPFGNPVGLKAPLAPLLRRGMDNQWISAELYEGAWTDVGTPARLNQLNQTTN